MYKSKYRIQSVVVHKPTSVKKAMHHAQDILKKEVPHRETEHSYRFKNMSKKLFDPASFRTKMINSNLSIVIGKKHKSEPKEVHVEKKMYHSKKEMHHDKEHEYRKQEHKEHQHFEKEEHEMMGKIKQIEKMIHHLSKMVK